MKKQIATLKRRGLSAFLALALCVSLVQVNAFALEPEGDPAPVESSGDSAALEIDLGSSADKQEQTPSQDDPEPSQDPASNEATPLGEDDPAPSQDPAPSEGDPVPDPDPAAEGDGEGDGTDPGQEEGNTDPAEETPQEPEEGSVKTDEVLDNVKDQLPAPPEGYEKQEDGSYTKPGLSYNTKDTTTDNVDNVKTTTETNTTKNITYSYEINEVKDEETGAFLGYEAVTSIHTDYEVKTTKTEEKKETTSLPVDTEAVLELTNDSFPIELKNGNNNGNNGCLTSQWSAKDGVEGLIDMTVRCDGYGTNKHPSSIICTFKTTEGPDENGVTIVTTTVTTYKVQYSKTGTYPKPILGITVNSSKETKVTTTVTESTEKYSDPVVVANKKLLTVEQDADGVITYKAPVANDSSVEDLTPVTPDVDKFWPNNLLNPTTKEPIEVVDSDFIFRFLGESALRSAIRLNPYGKTDMNNESFTDPVSLYILRDENGNAFYAYCADQKIEAVPGTDYSLGNFGDGKTLSAETAAQVQAAALNGYWGTTDGFGSLASIKETLKQALASGKIDGVTETQIDNLSDGAAMTATQAAIWYLMNGDKIFNTEDPFQSGYMWNPAGTGSAAGTNILSKVEPAAKALYHYLLETAQAPEEMKPATDIIRADDLKEVKIDVIDVSKEATVDSAAVYNADVSFILDVDVDRMNSNNLVVTLIDAKTGEKIGEPYQLLDARQDGGDGKTYTLKNVQLPNGTTITLKLNGTQNVEKNAYLILADTGHEMSQTFVGVMEGDYNVDLSMNVNFSINDITVKPEDPTPTPDPNPTPTPTPKPDPTPDPEDPPVDVPDPDVPLVPGVDPEEPPVDIPDPDVPLTPAPPEVVDVPDPAVPLAPRPAKPAKTQTSVPMVTEIPDEAVPLADVPQTGDDTGLWYAIALAAAAGLACAKLLEKKKAQ